MSVAPTVPSVFSFRCTARGKCCNSSPQMSLPELFHHRDLFIGCLAIRRFRLVTPGAPASFRGRDYRFTSDDRAASADLYDTLLFKVGASDREGYIGLFTQAFTYSSQHRCPALADDGRCSIHDDRLPALCAAVPLDPLVPDHMQHVVLASRNMTADFFGASCIVENESDDFVKLTREGGIADDGYGGAVRRRRADLEAEKKWWGNAVFAALRKELFDSPSARASIPFDGFFYVSLVPVLLEIARRSGYGREGCLAYLDAQLKLIDGTVKSAIARRREIDKPVTHQLRAWAKSYLALQKVLSTSETAGPEQGELRSWLG